MLSHDLGTQTGFVLVLLGSTFLISAQTKSRFEIASVRPNNTHTGKGVFPSPGMLRIQDLTLKELIRTAYGIERISGGPGWAEELTYDIIAKAGYDAKPADMFPMLRSLLADRFRLVIREEVGTAQGYWLVTGERGPRMERIADEDSSPPSHRLERGKLIWSGKPMAKLASLLAQELEEPVLDRTGLEGRYSFVLEWLADGPATRMGEIRETLRLPDVPPRNPVAVALPKVGLKLQRKPIQVGIIVIEGAEKPPVE